MSGLVRMTSGEHAELGDQGGGIRFYLVHADPGNERYVSVVINMLFRRGRMWYMAKYGSGACFRPCPAGSELGLMCP